MKIFYLKIVLFRTNTAIFCNIYIFIRKLDSSGEFIKVDFK